MAIQTLNNLDTMGTQRGKINLNFAELNALKIEASVVLTKTNTIPFTPSGDYNPVPKIYADNLSAAIKTTYDPTNINGDAFNRSNHHGTILPAVVAQDADNRFVSDAEKAAWSGKEDSIGAKGTAFNKSFGTVAGSVATGDHSHTKAEFGLEQVDNTSDDNKGLSIAAIAESATKADIATTYNKTDVDTLMAAKRALTNLQFGDVAGGNYTEIESTGFVVHHGDSRPYRDINFDISSMGKAVAGDPDLINLSSSNIEIAAFNGTGATEEVSGARELQHDYAQGTNLKPHVHWYSTDTGTGNVLWQLEYIITQTGLLVPSSTTITVVSAAPGVAWQRVDVEFPDISGLGLGIGDQLHVRFFRDSGDALDTYESDAAVATFGIHYRIDSGGSRSVTSK